MKNNEQLLKMAEHHDFYGLLAALRENVREENLKKSGVKSRDIGIIKKCMSGLGKYRKGMVGYHSDGKEYAFVDGYRIFVSSNSFGYEAAETRFNFESFRLDGVNNTEIAYHELDRADIAAFEALSKAHRGKYDQPRYSIEYRYQAEDYEIGFKPQFLLDAIDFVGNTKMHYCDTNAYSPVWFIGEGEKSDRWALVLPMRKNV